MCLLLLLVFLVLLSRLAWRHSIETETILSCWKHLKSKWFQSGHKCLSDSIPMATPISIGAWLKCSRRPQPSCSPALNTKAKQWQPAIKIKAHNQRKFRWKTSDKTDLQTTFWKKTSRTMTSARITVGSVAQTRVLCEQLRLKMMTRKARKEKNKR